MLCLLYASFNLCPISKTKEDLALAFILTNAASLPTTGPEPNRVQGRQTINGGATGETMK